MHLLARRPDALEACVFVLPAVLDEPRTDASDAYADALLVVLPGQAGAAPDRRDPALSR